MDKLTTYNKKYKPPAADLTTHNGYEMEYIFPQMKKPLLLSEYFDADVWQYMVSNLKEPDNTFSVGVHIRRISFVNKKWAIPEVSYWDVNKQLAKSISNSTFFVFSDEIEWCT
jgi:hypothetical protein